jgi:hypothetical protein
MFHAAFWTDLAERVLWTFVQAFAGSLASVPLLEVVLPDGTVDLTGLQTILTAATIAGLSAVLSVLKGVAAARLGNAGTAQILPTGRETYDHGLDLESPDERVFD